MEREEASCAIGESAVRNKVMEGLKWRKIRIVNNGRRSEDRERGGGKAVGEFRGVCGVMVFGFRIFTVGACKGCDY